MGRGRQVVLGLGVVLVLVLLVVSGVALAQRAAPRPAAPVPAAQTLASGALDALGGIVGLQFVAGGLSAPVAMAQPADGSGRLFLVDQVGQIWVLASNGQVLPRPFLDLRDRMVRLRPTYDERGLLGLALHPNFAHNGRFFVYYSAPLRAGAPLGYDHTARLSEFTVASNDPNLANPLSERVLLAVDEPQANNNGGGLAFGPDGDLYLGLGDGGASGDVGLGHVQDWFAPNPGGNGQDISHNLLGSILRLDVDHAGNATNGAGYSVPPNNPFIGRTALPEIYAYGFRNPYRFSFDLGGNHDLLAGDPGENLWEEVDVVQKGGNYGWNVMEGTHCFDAINAFNTPPECPETTPSGETLQEPVIEYPNVHTGQGMGTAVIGGYRYRGRLLPQLEGQYVFGDWTRNARVPDGTLWVAQPEPRGLWPMRELHIAGSPSRRLGLYVLGFGQDQAGELYVLTSGLPGPTGNTGHIFKLVPAG